MKSALLRKDTLVLRREFLLEALLIAVIMLVIISLLTGLQRERVFVHERAEAQRIDKEVWMGQGARNPHSAAHFSRYAFRPASQLALLDPGTSDFAGLAIWMEAHYQDPAVFRRAEDSGELSRYVMLSPAFLLLTAVPLLIFLMMHGSVAGEREDGTLRQLLATGVRRGQFFVGKFRAGWDTSMLVYTPIFLFIAGCSLVASPVEITADTLWRLLAMYAVYAVYLSICVAVALGISALCRTRQAAFLALAGLWVVMTVLVPRFATDVGTTLTPQPDARQTERDLRAASRVLSRDEQMQKRIRDDVLARYGVADEASLPINYSAYRLQASEELAVPEFERLYRALEERYRAQEGALRWFSLASPTIATASLSRGIAGTDRTHQRAFATAAEMHRREMIKLLNEDYMHNAGDAGFKYTADTALWERFDDFDAALPALTSVGRHYFADAVLLLLWLCIAMFAAYGCVRRAIVTEAEA